MFLIQCYNSTVLLGFPHTCNEAVIHLSTLLENPLQIRRSWKCNFLRLSINAHRKQSFFVFQRLLLVSKPAKWLRLFFVPKHLVMVIIMYQTNTEPPSSNLYNESNAENKFAFKCWSCHASNVVHQLPSFCALHFAIFADEVVLLIFVLQPFSWNHSPIYFFAPLFLRLKHFEASALLCVVEGIMLDIGLNLWHSLVLQSQISYFSYSLKKSVSCVKLFSLKNFTPSLNESRKAHYFCFLLLIRRSTVQQKSN